VIITPRVKSDRRIMATIYYRTSAGWSRGQRQTIAAAVIK